MVPARNSKRLRWPRVCTAAQKAGPGHDILLFIRRMCRTARSTSPVATTSPRTCPMTPGPIWCLTTTTARPCGTLPARPGHHSIWRLRRPLESCTDDSGGATRFPSIGADLDERRRPGRLAQYSVEETCIPGWVLLDIFLISTFHLTPMRKCRFLKPRSTPLAHWTTASLLPRCDRQPSTRWPEDQVWRQRRMERAEALAHPVSRHSRQRCRAVQTAGQGSDPVFLRSTNRPTCRFRSSRRNNAQARGCRGVSPLAARVTPRAACSAVLA